MQTFLKGNPTVNALVASIVAVSMIVAMFALFEPIVSYGQTPSDAFTITQEITSELRFLTQPNDVTMGGTAIAGLTGGTRYGTSTFNISTNDPEGYTVSIAFDNVVAMQGIGAASGTAISNYLPGGNPSYNFSVAAGDTAFAYSVNNETTPTDIDSSFKDNGSNSCGGHVGTQVGKCWYNEADATGGEQIIDSAGPTPGTGATSTVVFVVGVGADPDPALVTGFYVATATLTANVKP